VVTGLTPGTTYDFIVEARNIINLSAYSAEVQVLAVQTADKPTDLEWIFAETNAY
jgi:hypothetical protein